MRPSPSSLLAAALIACLGVDTARAACFPQCRSGYVCQGDTCVAEPSTAKPAAPATTPPPKQPTVPPRLVLPPVIDPAGPAPQPIDPVAAKRLADARAKRAAARTDLKLNVIVAAGYSFNTLTAISQTLNPRDSEYPMEISGNGPGLVVGLGVRKNVVRHFGVQAGLRVHGFYFGIEPDVDSHPIGREDHDISHSGFGLRVSGDFSLRVGPFAHAFPMFLGFGAIVAADVVFGTLSFTGVTKTPDVSFTEVHLRGGPIAELGFVFGDAEQYELGLRGEFMVAASTAESDDAFNSFGFFLSFGVSLL